jgi:hypothetical protein
MMPPEEINAYYYDEDDLHWNALPKVAIHRGTSTVESMTTHFTFMINAVLVLPEHPGVVSFNPNSIKDLKAADPSSGIDLMEPPQGNNQGTARIALPIRLPRGRGAYEPDVRLVYDSSTPNSWVGVGWDLPMSKIEVDTKFGRGDLPKHWRDGPPVRRARGAGLQPHPALRRRDDALLLGGDRQERHPVQVRRRPCLPHLGS